MAPFTPGTPPTIPRDRWSAHPRYPSQTLLLRSHQGFRRLSRHLVDAAERGENPVVLGALFRHWIGAMHGHEAYEEGKLYPYLERRWGASLAALRDGHHALHGCQDEVFAAIAQIGFGNTGDDTARVRLHAALAAHDKTLDGHLNLEEDVVIPMLLELSPEEFEDYYNSPIGQLLARLDDDP